MLPSPPTTQFNRLKKAKGGRSILLTSGQEDWLTIQRMMATTKPRAKYVVPRNPVRRWAFRVVMAAWFDWFMVFVILANILSMFLTHEGMDAQWENALALTNVAFTSVYFLEMLLKMLGIGLRMYFKVRACPASTAGEICKIRWIRYIQ